MSLLLRSPLCSLLIGLALCAGLLPASLYAQTAPPAPRLTVSLSAGATDFGLDGLPDLYRDVVKSYQAAGVAIPVQQVYPTSATFGGAVRYDVWRTAPATLALGLDAAYGRTTASSLYGDFAGTLDVTSAIRMWMLSGSVQTTFRSARAWQPFVQFRGGMVHGSTVLTEAATIDLSEFNGPTSSSNAQLSASGWSWAGALTGGVRRALGPVVLAAHGGIRLARVTTPDAEFVQSANNPESTRRQGTLTSDLDFTGWVARFAIELPIRLP